MADINRWAAPWPRSAAPPAHCSLSEYMRARLWLFKRNELAARGPSKQMRITGLQFVCCGTV